MQKIEAIINSKMLSKVQKALEGFGVTGMTVLEVYGLGREAGYTAVYRGNEYWVSLLPKVKIELLIEERIVDECVKIIAKAARTGKIGDGKIFISPIQKVIRIRTGEEGTEAL